MGTIRGDNCDDANADANRERAQIIDTIEPLI